MHPSTDPGLAAPKPIPISPGRLVLSTVLALVALTAGVAALGLWLRAPLTAVGRTFVEQLGGPGVAIGFLLPDALTIPLPNDTFLALAVAGGMSFWRIVVWATLGSLAGGSLGWRLGRSLGRTRRVERFLGGRGAVVDQALRRHGAWVVALAAVTPLPYSVSAWAAGSTQMPYRTFLSVSLLRVFRVAGALYLVELGLLAGA
jgi:membrane protein YqaA with SNARE-associated domain